MESLRKHKVTIGVLSFVIATLLGTGILFIRVRAGAEGIAAKVMTSHEAKDIETAHPGSKRIIDRLDRIQQTIESTREDLARIEGGLHKQ